MPTTTDLLRHMLVVLVLALTATTLSAQEDEAERDDPDAEIDPRFEQAQGYHLEGKFPQAFAIYDEILAERPKDTPTLVTYGNMLWKLGRLDEAEQYLKRAQASMPKHIKARQFLGQLYVHQGRRTEAREVFNGLLGLEWIRDDVRHSALLNLGKLDLLDEKWRDARKNFRVIRKEGGKADRKSGDRGYRRVKEMLELDDWPRVDGRHLIIHFSPESRQFQGAEAKKKIAEELDQWLEKVVGQLDMKMPEPWHLYVFTDDDECRFMTGRDTAHGWDYSWWLSYTALAEKEFSMRHTLAAQIAARWGGSRPISRSLVEGFCAFLADDLEDPHALARELHARGKLPGIIDLHRHQRRQAQYGAGISYTRYLIQRFGSKKFERFWKHFNITVNAPQYKDGISKKIDWEVALKDLYRDSFDESFEAIETAWRVSLAQ